MNVRRIINQWIKSSNELSGADTGGNILKKKGNNSLIHSLKVWKEQETKFDYKFLQREIERILKGCQTYWFVVKDYHLEF